MKPIQLFFKRLLSEWKLIYNTWSTVINWTLALYIIIPGLIIAVVSYIHLWNQPPAWVFELPLYIPLQLIYLYTWTGTIRLFLDEADQLFLLQKRDWIRKIMDLGMIYSAVCSLLITLLLFFILAPFLLLVYELSTKQILLLFALSFLLKMTIGFIKQLISLRLKSWQAKTILIIILVLIQPLFVIGTPLLIVNSLLCFTCCALLILTLLLLIKIRFEIKGTFLEDITLENKERVKHAAAILGMSGVSIKKPSSKRKRPIFFSRFNHLFQERNTVNGLTEVFFKSFLRNQNDLIVYVLLVTIGIVLVSDPQGSSLLLWPFLAFILTQFAKFHWNEVITSDYIKMFQWKTVDVRAASMKSMLLLSVPGFLLISSALGFSLFNWAGAIGILPVGFGLIHYVTKIVCMWHHASLS
jgi:ABC-2 type transport system permease protein